MGQIKRKLAFYHSAPLYTASICQNYYILSGDVFCLSFINLN